MKDLELTDKEKAELVQDARIATEIGQSPFWQEVEARLAEYDAEKVQPRPVRKD